MTSKNVRKGFVSIGMPVYNGECYLEQAIRSVLEQTHPDFELIISDNASTDRTQEICKSFAESDSRVKYFRNDQNIGAAENYNRLFQLSSGEYFRWSNADDLIAPQLIEKTLSVLEARPDAVIAFGRTELIDAEGKSLGDYEDNLDIQADAVTVRYSEFYSQVGLTNVIYGLMRSSAVANTNLMGNGSLPASDISFMAAMILQGKFVGIQERLFFRRMHGAAFSANPDPSAQAHFWRATAKRTPLPLLRAVLTDMTGIMGTSLPLSDKLGLLVYCLKRLNWQRQALMQEFLQLFRGGPRL